MKARQLLTIASMILFSSTSFGKTPHSLQLLEKTLLQKSSMLQKNRILAAQCANFSGNWRGSCVYQDGKVENDEMTIEQDKCSAITINGLLNIINGMFTVSNSVDPSAGATQGNGNSTISSTYVWNDSQTHLKGLMSAFYPIWGAITVTNSMWIAADQLRTKDGYSSLVNVDGPMDVVFQKSECTYDRIASGH